MDANKLSCGLFVFRGKNWWRNLKDIPIFIKRIFFTLKHGYSPVAQFETFEWFMDVMKEILTNYRYNRMGSPVVIDNFFDVKEENSNDVVNEEEYNAILDRMIVLLDLMDEHNQLYNDMNWKEADKKKEDAKNEFFKLFSEQFYGLWD
ncbi:MAG: hypothetical protein SO471_08025 [Anaerobutyricum hallii]|uniref:hypothetical protein n=1 Tax=Anaerobutyricum hallii TaxID=39488 RepID=UPI002A82DE8F|nr:hypothetical protein [Anaerobutyricum hallii]MDY4577897.1 hypothetical protein [Anaerobutyricum hallii]